MHSLIIKVVWQLPYFLTHSTFHFKGDAGDTGERGEIVSFSKPFSENKMLHNFFYFNMIQTIQGEKGEEGEEGRPGPRGPQGEKVSQLEFIFFWVVGILLEL